MSIRKLKGSWWVDFQYNRRRVRKRSPVNTKSGAQAYEIRLRNKILSGKRIDIDHDEENKKTQLFKKFAWEWFETYVINNNKYSEIKMKQYILKSHLIPYFGQLSINQITTLKVEKYKKRKDMTAIHRKTINNQLTVLRKCLKSAKDWKILDDIPQIQHFKVPPAKFDFLTEEEAKILLQHAEGIWREMILVALRTGLRLGELIALSWQDIDFGVDTLTVRHSIVRNILGSPKSNKVRYIPLVNELVSILRERKEKSGHIFTYRGRFLRTDYCRNTLARICKKAGLRRIGWHKLRHSFASHLIQKNAPIKAVQELMGHADIQTTMRYAHLAPSTLRSTVDLLEPEQNHAEKCQPSVNRKEILKLNDSGIRIILPKISKKQD